MLFFPEEQHVTIEYILIYNKKYFLNLGEAE